MATYIIIGLVFALVEELFANHLSARLLGEMETKPEAEPVSKIAWVYGSLATLFRMALNTLTWPLVIPMAIALIVSALYKRR